MASKLNLSDVTTSLASQGLLNANFSLIESELDDTISRSGKTPNSMSVDFDMNTHRITNLSDGIDPQDAASLSQVTQVVLASGATLLASETAAAQSALDSAASAAASAASAVTSSTFADNSAASASNAAASEATVAASASAASASAAASDVSRVQSMGYATDAAGYRTSASNSASAAGTSAANATAAWVQGVTTTTPQVAYTIAAATDFGNLATSTPAFVGEDSGGISMSIGSTTYDYGTV